MKTLNPIELPIQNGPDAVAKTLTRNWRHPISGAYRIAEDICKEGISCKYYASSSTHDSKGSTYYFYVEYTNGMKVRWYCSTETNPSYTGHGKYILQ